MLPTVCNHTTSRASHSNSRFSRPLSHDQLSSAFSNPILTPRPHTPMPAPFSNQTGKLTLINNLLAPKAYILDVACNPPLSQYQQRKNTHTHTRR